jgi:hypothetical protein
VDIASFTYATSNPEPAGRLRRGAGRGDVAATRRVRQRHAERRAIRWSEGGLGGQPQCFL